jgi:hypothetical protein
LKECADEIDLGTQYHLTRYAFLFESIVLSDGSTLAPTGIEDGMYCEISSEETAPLTERQDLESNPPSSQ